MRLQRISGIVLLSFVVLLGTCLVSWAAQVARPNFSVPHGHYDAAFSVRITSATAGSAIRYTTDGSKPSTTHGTALANGGTISITTTTPLRACAYKSGMSDSRVFTQTYIFVNDVVRQTKPAGYPDYWTNAGGWRKAADYDMDQVIVNHSRYSGRIRNDLKALPTLSLVLPRVSMFGVSGGADGVYQQGGGHGGENTLEKECSVELIKPGRTGFQIDCGVKGHSGTPWKRSLRLLFKSNYGGPQKLEYPIFEDTPRNKGSDPGSFGKIFLRMGHNDSWNAFWLTSKIAKATYLRDPFIRHSMIEMNGFGRQGMLMHLYINGLYWGIYDAQERPDARMAADHLGGSKTDWYAVNMGGTVSGNAFRYNTLNNSLVQYGGFAVPSKYNTVKQYLDVERFADYVMLGWYVGAADWGGNNFYAIVRNNPAGGVKYMVWDMDVCLSNVHGIENRGAWVSPTFLGISGRAGDIQSWMCKTWRACDDNKDFVMMFADRVYKHCFNDGALSESQSLARWDALVNNALPGIVCESARWGDNVLLNYGGGTPRCTQYDHWTPACNDVRNNMLVGNVGRFISALRYRNYYPNLNPPTFAKRGGTVSAGYQLTISRNNSYGTIYYRTDGQYPRVDGGAVRSGSDSGVASAVATLSTTCTVKARVKNGASWSVLEQAQFTISGGTAPPSAPSGLTASAVSASQINLAWTDNSNNEDGFKIRRSTDGVNFAEIHTTAANATTYTDTGLSASTTYYYKVKATGAEGGSAYSDVASATTDEPAGEPAIAVSTSSIAVSCNLGEDAGAETVQVWNSGTGTLLYRLVEASSWFSLAPTTGSSTGSADKQTHTITFTTASKPAGVHQRSFTVEDNVSGAVNGPITVNLQITVNANALPDAPSDLQATVVSATEIALSWTASGTGETGFRVRRSLDGVDFYTLSAISVGPGVTTATDTGLAPNTTYYYKVKATDSTGGTGYSNIDSATTPGLDVSAWIAFNDLAHFPGQPNQNCTTYTTTNGNPTGVNQGRLKDYNSSTDLPVTLAVAGGMGVLSHQGAHPAVGTDAHVVFDGKLSGAGTISYGTEDLVLTLAGLDESNRYEIVLYSDRNEVNYTGAASRYNQVTLQGADPFENACSPGVTAIGMNSATAMYNAGHNNAGGLVARFTHIAPGADGTIALRLKQDRTQSCYSYANALMVRTLDSSLLSAADDGDRNDLNDNWEVARFGGTGASAAADPDGDGVSNQDEYVAGSDPAGASSVFAVDVGFSEGGLQVSFATTAIGGPGYEDFTARHYALEAMDAQAADQRWTPVAGYEDIVGDGSVVKYLPGATGQSIFYRARVWIEK